MTIVLVILGLGAGLALLVSAVDKKVMAPTEEETEQFEDIRRQWDDE